MQTLKSFDTETTGRIIKPFIATSYDGKNQPYLYDLSAKKDYEKLKNELEHSKNKKIFHNASFDIYALRNIGIKVYPPYHDTMILAHLINENYESRKLKKLANIYLNEPCVEEKELKKVITNYKKLCKKENRTFFYSEIPKDILYPYAKKDAEYTYNLWEFFMRNPKNQHLLTSRLYNLELHLIPIIINMERRGIPIDRKFCQYELKRLHTVYNETYSKIINIVGKFINPNSNKQLSEYIKSQNNIIIKSNLLTKKGNISTNKDSIKILKEYHPVFGLIERCRAINKVSSTYYQSLLDFYTEENDNIAHFLLYQTGAKTGRFSADLIQTIPKIKTGNDNENIDTSVFRVRKAFLVRPGYTNFYFDYDQIEMRLFAHFSKNNYLISAINNGEDPHQATANDIFGKNASLEERRISKTLNFAIIYGMGIELLLKSLGLSRKEGLILLQRYHTKYRVKEYIRNVTAELYRKGFISVDWINRTYRVPQEFAYKGVNIVIQGSAAYIMKLAMLNSLLVSQKYPGLNLILTIHDELVFEIPLEYYKQYHIITKEIKNLMETRNLFDVPITVSCDYSTSSWADKKKWKF